MNYLISVFAILCLVFSSVQFVYNYKTIFVVILILMNVLYIVLFIRQSSLSNNNVRSVMLPAGFVVLSCILCMAFLISHIYVLCIAAEVMGLLGGCCGILMSAFNRMRDTASAGSRVFGIIACLLAVVLLISGCVICRMGFPASDYRVDADNAIDENNFVWTVDTNLNDLYRIKSFEGAADYMFGHGDGIVFTKEGLTLAQVQKAHPTWGAEDSAYGINRLLQVAESGNSYMYKVYSEDEIAQEPDRNEVRLFYLPAIECESNTSFENKPYVLLTAGGAYTGVCSIEESFPVAARLNELGYNVFVLNYRVNELKLLPKPLEDIAATVKYIQKHEKNFGVDGSRYIAGGFSAGGNLAALWGTKAKGYAVYGLPAPQAEFLAYPLDGVRDVHETMGDMIGMIFPKILYGISYTETNSGNWWVSTLMDEDFPAIYMCMAHDDSTIPAVQYESIMKAMDEKDITCEINYVETGEHGFGLGTGTDAQGWVDSAVAFYESL